MIYFYIGLAGSLGAISRYLVGTVFLSDSIFPFATLLINLVGCYALAYLTSRFSFLSSQLKTVIGTGFLGAFTTFSALSVETVKLFEHGKISMALLYIVVSIVGGILMSNLGWKKEVSE